MENKTIYINNDMPALAMRGLVIFPGMLLQFDIGREISVNALKAAMDTDKRIFLVTQRDIKVNTPERRDLYNYGVIAEVKQMLKTNDGVSRVLVYGLKRAKLIDISNNGRYLTADIEFYDESITPANPKLASTQALMRGIKESFDEFSMLLPKIPPELYASVIAESNPEKLFESIAFNVPFPIEDKQKLLECKTTKKRLEILNSSLKEELEILKLEKKIQDDVKEQMDQNQREYYLHEQMKAISAELGEDNCDDADEFYERLSKLSLPEEAFEKIYKEIEKLAKLPQGSHETTVIYNYLDTVLSLPWNTKTKDKTDINKVKAQLDKDHYGLEKVKERILELISVRALTPDVKGQIICLAGPPGVGKTSIGRSIADALGRKYARVSLGGIKDESDIRGHRKTYVGAMPGRIINALLTAKSKNPLILLDEIDKMSNDFRGDPASAMLEVLDSEQNCSFVDHFIEIGFDLSDALFVTTANSLDSIPTPLLDRMEVIELGSYTREEKFHIAKNHLVKKQLKNNGLTASKMKITDEALYTIIDAYTKEAGVRNLEREISKLCRKCAKEIVSGNAARVTFTKDNLEKYLGKERYRDDEVSKSDEIGVVNGLAWTSVGGVMMPLEAVALSGTGKIEITGNLGDVMNESARLAVSYARCVANKYSIAEDFYKTKDIHIHAIEGAVPKDGPSAGVTMATAIISALSEIPVNHDVAMTGEITLHGKVLPIGGLREKTMAAYKAGMKTIIIPYANKADLEEVDETVKENCGFVLAKTLDDVLNVALCSEKKAKNEVPVVSGIIENPIGKKTTRVKS